MTIEKNLSRLFCQTDQKLNTNPTQGRMNRAIEFALRCTASTVHGLIMRLFCILQQKQPADIFPAIETKTERIANRARRTAGVNSQYK